MADDRAGIVEMLCLFGLGVCAGMKRVKSLWTCSSLDEEVAVPSRAARSGTLDGTYRTETFVV